MTSVIGYETPVVLSLTNPDDGDINRLSCIMTYKNGGTSCTVYCTTSSDYSACPSGNNYCLVYCSGYFMA
jgi:hypothetical protein